MSALAGDLPGFEEATRQLYAGDWEKAERIVRSWPQDLGSYFVERLQAAAGRRKVGKKRGGQRERGKRKGHS